MRINLDADQQDAALGAMLWVSQAKGAAAVTPADRHTIAAAAEVVFGRPPGGSLPGPVDPAGLAARLPGPAAAEAMRLITVVALVDGSIDAARIDRLVACAQATGLGGADYVRDLAEAAHGHLHAALGCMIRANMESVTGRPWSGNVTSDVAAYLLPYNDKPDPALAARFHALEHLPPESFGNHFFHHFRDNGYAFPGEPNGLSAVFCVPHDSCHVLAGYDTTPPGEILVSTFTAAMHPKNSMAAHVLPVIVSWHLGIKLNDVAASATGALKPGAFFEAWERGAGMNTDLFKPGWDFFAVVSEDIEALRARYAIVPRRFPLDA
ncbi:MAG: hypothetical protein J0I31_15155 [Rhizobiales bacterium]|nr:hypothetical protein [Hyphomicrobiales bacterium]